MKQAKYIRTSMFQTIKKHTPSITLAVLYVGLFALVTHLAVAL